MCLFVGTVTLNRTRKITLLYIVLATLLTGMYRHIFVFNLYFYY